MRKKGTLKCGRALCAHPLHRSERERESEEEGERERERERCRICPDLFLFLKGMTDALAPYLVY